MKDKYGVVKVLMKGILCIGIISVQVIVNGSGNPNLNGILKNIDSRIEEKSKHVRSINIENLGISPFTISVIGYEIDLSTYEKIDNNIKSSRVLNIDTTIDLNMSDGETVKFEIDKFDLVKNGSLLIKRNGVRDIELEKILKGKNELGQPYVRINEDDCIIKIDYPDEMNTYDKYEILIYIITGLLDGETIDKYISKYVKPSRTKRINIENRAEIQYEIGSNGKESFGEYSKEVYNKTEIRVPYKYPPDIE